MRGTPRAKISVWRVAEAMVDFAKPQHETLEERLRGLGMHIMFVCTGNIMPPKTTWFEPKLRSGLVIHKLD